MRYRWAVAVGDSKTASALLNAVVSRAAATRSNYPRPVRGSSSNPPTWALVVQGSDAATQLAKTLGADVETPL
ncbi:MAG: hypothetical protein M3071_06340 [Actinomycetota bacterium]|nr:hypothetical protein [Actinomycetota bacterium]